jgi:hypothetical protein
MAPHDSSEPRNAEASPAAQEGDLGEATDGDTSTLNSTMVLSRSQVIEDGVPEPRCAGRHDSSLKAPKSGGWQRPCNSLMGCHPACVVLCCVVLCWAGGGLADCIALLRAINQLRLLNPRKRPPLPTWASLP